MAMALKGGRSMEFGHIDLWTGVMLSGVDEPVECSEESHASQDSAGVI